MKPEDIKIWDWQRTFIGEVPPAFLWEIILRMAVIYFLLMLGMRLLGKRMASQLTRNELAAMVSLAAAIGVPILSPDRGLLPAFVITFVVVAISRLIAISSFKSEKFESLTQGAINTLVKDGVMDLKAMKKTRITKERLVSQLRSENITSLGEVKRLYIEANGGFTLLKENNHGPGLSVIPESDPEFQKELHSSGLLVCHECGMRNTSGKRNANCPNCNHTNWVAAVSSQPVLQEH